MISERTRAATVGISTRDLNPRRSGVIESWELQAHLLCPSIERNLECACDVSSRVRLRAVMEDQRFDQKSLRIVTGKSADFTALARDCVCFANGAGGQIAIGIEDDAEGPTVDQRVDAGLIGRIRQRIGELTVNVQVVPEIKRDPSGGEFILLTIPRALGVASTSDGRYFLRVGDDCQPIVGDDVLRLASERPATPWDLMVTAGVRRDGAESDKVAAFTGRLRASDRVAASVKEKSNQELLEHYVSQADSS